MLKFLSSSEEETKKIAENLAKEDKGRIFALNGPLGAGKTIFTQGFAKGLRVKDKIISPTFVLIRQYKIPNAKKTLYHIDLYRLENIKNIEHLGLKEIWSDRDNIVLIEWAEKIKNLLPKNTVWISIRVKSDNTRRISLLFSNLDL